MNGRWFRLSLSASLLALLTTGCTTRKPAGPAPPSYPVVPANSVRVLERLPRPPYEVTGTITVQSNADIDRDQTLSEIRRRAGNSGANAIVVLSEKVFTWRNVTIRQRLHTRRIVAQAIRLSFSP